MVPCAEQEALAWTIGARWLRYSDEEYRVAHLDAQGNTLSGYAFERPDSSLFMFEGPGWIDTKGDLWRIEQDPKRAEISVVRTGPSGEVWRTLLAPLPQPLGLSDPEGPRSNIFTWLVVDAMGRMHGVLVESGSRSDVNRAFRAECQTVILSPSRLSRALAMSRYRCEASPPWAPARYYRQT